MTIRLLWRLVLPGIMKTFEYRATFFVFMIGAVVSPMISLLVWLTVSDQGVSLPYERQQFISYYLLLILVNQLTASWAAEYDLADAIRLGRISPLLLRPVRPIVEYVADNLGQKAIMMPLLTPLVLLVGLFFHNDLRISANLWTWLIFALSVPIAATIGFLFDFITGTLAFWLQDVKGIIQAKMLVGAFLAGQIIPLELFPAQFTPFLRVQPFRYTLSFPIEILVGGLSRSEIAWGCAWQVGYCLVFWCCYRLLWRAGMRVYTATGA